MEMLDLLLIAAMVAFTLIAIANGMSYLRPSQRAPRGSRAIDVPREGKKTGKGGPKRTGVPPRSGHRSLPAKFRPVPGPRADNVGERGCRIFHVLDRNI